MPTYVQPTDFDAALPTVSATRLDEVSYMDVLNKGLNVMDATSITFCMDNDLPIVVFDVLTEGNITRVVSGERIGTLVSSAS